MNSLTKGTLKINPVLNCESLVKNQSNYSKCKAELLIFLKLFTSCSSSSSWFFILVVLIVLLHVSLLLVFALFCCSSLSYSFFCPCSLLSFLFCSLFSSPLCISCNHYCSVYLLLVDVIVFVFIFFCSLLFVVLFCPYFSFSVYYIPVIVHFLVLLFILFL